jgi:23S rRNA-/tRNA-specific pseudouridylate synthase
MLGPAHGGGAKLDMVTSYKVLHTAAIAGEEVKSFEGYQRISTGPEVYTYARFVIETGKKHQIRLNCQHALGCPILGDIKHGYKPESQLL